MHIADNVIWLMRARNEVRAQLKQQENFNQQDTSDEATEAIISNYVLAAAIRDSAIDTRGD